VHNDIEKRNYCKDRVLNVLCGVPKIWKPKKNVGDIKNGKIRLSKYHIKMMGLSAVYCCTLQIN